MCVLYAYIFTNLLHALLSSRVGGGLSRERCLLFLRQNCHQADTDDGFWTVKVCAPSASFVFLD